MEDLGYRYDPHNRAYRTPEELTVQDQIEMWRQFLDGERSRLEEAGWRIDVAEDFLYRFEYPDAVVVANEDDEGVNPWFELSFTVELGGRKLSLLPIVRSLLEQYETVDHLPEKLNLEFEEGRYLHIAADEIRPILETLFELFDKQEGETLIVKPHDAHLVSFDDGEHAQWKGLEELRELSAKLRDFDGIEPVEPAPTLLASLREYQLRGLSWLFFLHTFRFGGILADDMGLGKTVQTLALLDRLK